MFGRVKVLIVLEKFCNVVMKDILLDYNCNLGGRLFKYINKTPLISFYISLVIC